MTAERSSWCLAAPKRSAPLKLAGWSPARSATPSTTGALGFDAVVDLERTAGPSRPHKIASDGIAVGRSIELVVLTCKSNALGCRLLGRVREITLRTAVRDEVPGSILTVTPTRRWTHARHPYLWGHVEIAGLLR